MSGSQPSKALTKRPASNALMAPPPTPKRIKRPAIVLDEDVYTAAVEHIILRDYFPGLAETDAQREYLNAVESGNKGWIREAGKTLIDVMTPVPGGRRKEHSVNNLGKTPLGRGETPRGWAGDTPVTVAGTEIEEDESSEKKPKVDLSLSLNAFQAKYISEDQESFSRIIDRQNAKKFEQNKWMRSGNILPSNRRIAQQKVLEASKSSQEVVLRPSQNLDDRPAAPNTHKHVPFTALMYNPDSIEDWTTTRAQTAEAASLAPPKATLAQNTRFPAPDAIPDRPPSPTLSAVRDAINGRPRLTQSEAGFGDGSETPRVNNYRYLGSDDEDDDDDAPTDLLERFGAKADPSPFTINESTRREKLHLKMVERINDKNTNKDSPSSSSSAHTPGTTRMGQGIFGATPRFLSAPTPVARLGMTPGGAGSAGSTKKNIGNLTPAAQRLFERVGSGKGSKEMKGGFSGSEGKLGRDWTPTPKVRRKGQ